MLKDRFLKTYRSFHYAWKGIVDVAKSERNFKVHLFATAIVTFCGFQFSITNTEWLIVVISIGFVLGAELFNTAIERTIDIVSPEWNKKAGTVKDISAGATLVICISAFICGLLIFIPKINF